MWTLGPEKGSIFSGNIDWMGCTHQPQPARLPPRNTIMEPQRREGRQMEPIVRAWLAPQGPALARRRSLGLAALATAVLLSLLPPAPAASIVPAERAVSFTADVVPILTKAGCNMGACHAKAGGGQNGFQLSLLGFQPDEDYDHLLKESRGRRVSTAAPDQSLLLLKATASVPHGGGQRIAPDSEAHRVLLRWIGEGAGLGPSDLPALDKLIVEPAGMTLAPGASQPLRAIARYADGSTRDVTELALYESNDRARAEVDGAGVVSIGSIPGSTAVMVRFQGQVSVATFTVPHGESLADLPTPRNFIDEHVFERCRAVGVPLSPECDDATFLRRVSLDVTGSIPTAAEAEAFLADAAPDKRERLVDRLLASPGYADWFANKWTALLKNRRDDTSDTVSNFAFHSWVRDSLLANKPYDRFVRELLAATGTIVENPPVAWYKRVKEPKDQIEDVAQLFLGVRIGCAQCHHHPFERWSQDDYHGLAAYFSQVGRRSTSTRGEDLIFHKRGVAAAVNPKTTAKISPSALGTPEGPIPADEDPRLRLADWLVRPDNPFFARALVNRYWKHFLGRGLVEPEDDLRDTNPPTNPALLDALAEHFRQSKFDLKALVRTIVLSRTYQTSTVPLEGNAADLQHFSHFLPRRLPAEVLLDSIDAVTGSSTTFANLPAGTRAIALPDTSYNRSSPFLQVFGRPDGQSVCECERVQSSSLSQSLHLLSAADIKGKLSADGGRADRLSKDERPDPEKIREVFLATFARLPTDAEMAQAVGVIAEPRTSPEGQPLPDPQARRENLEDLLWALVNAKEFLFNH